MTQRGLHELLDTVDPMWPIIQQWLASATHPVTVVPVDRQAAEATLIALNVTTRSPLGAMAYETGGILVDHGWLRLLGTSSDGMRDSLLTWNNVREQSIDSPLANAMIIAHDAVGGFFAANLGAFGNGPRSIFYFAPDTLRWMDLELSYSDFLRWAISEDLNSFYADLRWTGWEQEVSALDGDHGLTFWPMLWATGPRLEERSRRSVPQRELWSLHRELARQIAELPAGSKIHIQITNDDASGTS